MGNYTYQVKYGDTLSGIAKQYNTTVDEIAKLNGIPDPNKVQAGVTLKLPTPNGVDNVAEGVIKETPKATYTAPTYTESDTVKQAQAALNTQLANKPGEYSSQWQTQLDDVINKILNREKFSYDLNGDALYHQYKDKYIQQGKMAMGDAIGQASAMTGGYGNSYAQSVGQQAYQAQLQNLNDIVPELYAMAYDKYNQEGQDLYNQYSMLGTQEEQDYGRYRDQMSDWLTERDYLANRYDSERNFGYGQYRDNVADEQWQTAYDYQQQRDNEADEQWWADFNENKRQFDATVDNDALKAEIKRLQDELAKKDEDKPQYVYQYEETPAVKSFVAKIRTRSEFARGNNPDKQQYGTYENYVRAMLEKYEGELSENDIATISQKFGL